MIMCEMENGKKILFSVYTICCVVESKPGYCTVYTSDEDTTIVKCSIEEFYRKVRVEAK